MDIAVFTSADPIPIKSTEKRIAVIVVTVPDFLSMFTTVSQGVTYVTAGFPQIMVHFPYIYDKGGDNDNKIIERNRNHE
jgi:hypothetical protein